MAHSISSTACGDMSASDMPSAVALNSIVAVQAGLAAIGWELRNVDADIDRARLRIDLACGNLHVTFDAAGRRAWVIRERWNQVQVRIGRNVVTRIVPELIGRDRCEGMRQGLWILSAYVADNSTPELTREQVRDIFRPLLTA